MTFHSTTLGTVTHLRSPAVALREAEAAYRARPSAVSFAKYRFAVYRAHPTASNQALYRRAAADSRMATARARAAANAAAVARAPSQARSGGTSGVRIARPQEITVFTGIAFGSTNAAARENALSILAATAASTAPASAEAARSLAKIAANAPSAINRAEAAGLLAWVQGGGGGRLSGLGAVLAVM